MHTARNWFNRKGAPARHAVDLKAFGVASDDRTNALTFAELDCGDMCQRDVQAVDLAFLVDGDPHPAIIGAAARNGFCGGKGREKCEAEGGNACAFLEFIVLPIPCRASRSRDIGNKLFENVFQKRTY